MLLAAATVSAQPLGKQYSNYPVEAFVSAGGGLSTLLYSPQVGDYRFGLGGQAGVGAAYHFLIQNYHFELDGGAEISFYNARTIVDKFNYLSPDIKFFGTPYFKVDATLTGYEEQQRAVVLTFPVMLRHHFKINVYDFYAGLGIKLGFPVSSNYRVKQGELSVVAPSEYEGYTYEHLSAMGFDDYSASPVNNAEIIAGTTAIAALEFGARWKLPKDLFISGSIYADIGLNNIKRSSSTEFVHYYPAAEGSAVRTGSVATSLRPNSNEVMAKRIAPLAVGVKVAIHFGGWNKKSPVGVDMLTHQKDIAVAKPKPIAVAKDTVAAVKPKPVEKPKLVAVPATPVDTPKVSDLTYKAFAAGNDDNDDNKPYYSVQVMAANYIPNMAYFNTLTAAYPQFKMKTIAKGDATHYIYGSFTTFEDALRYAKLFIALGYDDAFVVKVEKKKIVKSYYNNKR
ncbi:hypothetical protein FACS189456_3990 [Bacteroidia bacterium]|nr:hypothetical protein FACS189456_3990 [Bacteroidia bacterium]